MSLFFFLLFLHVVGAIIAFGPDCTSMIVGPMVAKEPQHANFYARTQVAAGRAIVTPAAISMAVTGAALIIVKGWANVTGGRHWMELAILLYVVAVVVTVVVAMAVQAPAGRKLVELTSQPLAPAAGPSPELRATAARVRQGGMVMIALVVVIAFLMVTKPF